MIDSARTPGKVGYQQVQPQSQFYNYNMPPPIKQDEMIDQLLNMENAI